MGQRLADAAVCGTQSTTTGEAHELLAAGDLDGLFALQRARFGGFTMMADDDGPDDDADDSDDDGQDDDNDDADEGDDEESALQKRIDELNAENKRRRVKAREQRQQIEDLQKQINELKSGKGKGKDDQEGDGDTADTAKVAELEKDRESLMSDNDQLRIQLAFVSSTKHQWLDPDAALRLADLSDVEIDGGKVEGLDDALDALAKAKPYLLKKADDDADDEDEQERRRTRRTGQRTGSGRQGSSGSANRDKLVAKYPALRR